MGTGAEYVIMAVAAIGSGVMAYEANEQGKDIAEENKRLQALETQEEARRLEREQSKTEALARAKAAATGAGGESLDLYLEDMETQHNKELNWLKFSGASRNKIMGQEAEMAYTAGWGNVIGSAGSAAGYLGEGAEAGEWFK